MPGSELTLTVNEPSLNEGRKLCPNVKKSPNATKNNTAMAPTTLRLCRSDHSRATR